jgi:hypothetical protein
MTGLRKRAVVDALRNLEDIGELQLTIDSSSLDRFSAQYEPTDLDTSSRASTGT